MKYKNLTLILVTPEIAKQQPWKRGFPATTTLVQDMQNPKIRGDTTGQMMLEIIARGDHLYYWDGPWGVLSGSSGLAIVRAGSVVDTFTFVVS